jgi:hypothetical protein
MNTIIQQLKIIDTKVTKIEDKVTKI